MTLHAANFFVGHNALVPSGVDIDIRHNPRGTADVGVEVAALGAGEDFSHELGLAAQNDIHDTLTDLEQAVASSECVVPLFFSELDTLDLNIGVHGLASGALHDNVNGEAFQMGVEKGGGIDIFANELLNLRHCDVVWDLSRFSVSSFALKA
jgi:hypothetical protein